MGSWQDRLQKISVSLEVVLQGWQTWIGKVSIFLSNFAIVERVSEDDASNHAVFLRILDFCSSVYATITGQCDLAFKFNACVFQYLQVCPSSTAAYELVSQVHYIYIVHTLRRRIQQ